ncbi:UspA domain-containing protein [Desulfobulbus propionicus DSM 2032]|jgi:nucleotide-binding universal stress UspA family protein|uniref:UspA domain-containing protein n=1 Tax=Desulfobulbus propionicus (strain ATCC 33891 / DSM 2032 / VKM B-1956 / 1pr3) TaxID=577650 RepID=A0A7U4DPS1_DESPD|nr:universal stress protein [Desulfobulbus propionicus]ADW18446.1 UspA domain-containing protein [Desulfobulbus propionicus DSM 2032]
MECSGTSLLGEAKTLLVATDGSPFSEGAVREALFFGQACHARVIVLHVVHTQVESINAAHFAVRQGQQDLTPHLERIRVMAQDSGVAVEVVVIGSSTPEKAIVDQARLRQADVIVMGRHGKSGRLSLLVGKMTAKVIAQGFPRVLVAPRDCTINGSRILLAANDSANGRRAVEEALGLSRACAGLERLTVLTVAGREEDRPQAEALVAEICGQARRQGLRIPWEPLVAVGDPAACIVEAAQVQHVDMILIGGRGRGGVAKLLKGHVTEKVIGQASCAVLVVSA